MSKISETIQTLVKAECKRVIELLESDIDFDDVYGNRKLSELKCKMRELRRDTITLEKQIKED